MEQDMSNHTPIGACCAQPRFSDIRDDANDTRTFGRIAVVGGVFATIAALFAGAFLLFAR